MLSRSQVREHSGSYQTVSPTAPFGLLSLKAMFEEEDSTDPKEATLNAIFAQDFRDVENGTERSKGRGDVIKQIMTRRTRYAKYQTDVAHAWCITNSNKTQTVMFEGIRFITFKSDTEWVRIPLAGRLEVRAIRRGGKEVGEVVYRKLTLELSSFWKRKNEIQAVLTPMSPVPSQYKVAQPRSPAPNVYEMSGSLTPDPGRKSPLLRPDADRQGTSIFGRKASDADKKPSYLPRGPEYRPHEPEGDPQHNYFSPAPPEPEYDHHDEVRSPTPMPVAPHYHPPYNPRDAMRSHAPHEPEYKSHGY